VPVKANQVSRVDMVLSVGSVSEAIEVSAAPMMFETSSASASFSVSGPLSTPRVREYFPETLYWQPELVTDAAGRASIQVKLADSITTWHVAVLGSTLDGRVAEGSAEVRAFQPFLVDLDVPQVLTQSDEVTLPVPVRNYLEKPQKVAVTAKLPAALRLMGAVGQPGVVAPSSSANATLPLRAEAAVKRAPVRVTAIGGDASDAIEKPVSVHPDGERKVLAVGSVVASGQALPLSITANAIPASIQGEVKIYPSVLARVLEAMEALLEKPHGCGEQTISSSYPNLLLLRALKEHGLKDERLAARTLKNLRAGYQRLLGYQASDGGFTYWGHGDADVALTAYALSFLGDAKEFIEVDEDRVDAAREWLDKQPKGDPSTHALRLRALLRTDPSDAATVDKELGELARKAAEFGDPYALASFALAAMDANKPALAGAVIDQLRQMAKDERGAAYWAFKSNTPYHGWGRSGQVETTAMVVSALAHWRKSGHTDATLDALIDRGALFLLSNGDAGGAWSSSQATVRALTALLDMWTQDDAKAMPVEVLVNGVSAGKVALPAGRAVQAPVVVDIARLLRPGENQISLTGFGSRALQAQFNAAWYETWGPKRPAKELDMQIGFSTLQASINDAVACDVLVSRPSFRGYGMMIAEVGLPPGAEVDRGSLEDVVKDWQNGVDSYEVAPDHVTFYVWPVAAGTKIHFVFRPRYAMKARAAQSLLYDYYNPDERVVLEPERFVVRQ
jgi:uncharacterized protein YfaS (alpha-2-macroglobulin family)